MKTDSSIKSLVTNKYFFMAVDILIRNRMDMERQADE